MCERKGSPLTLTHFHSVRVHDDALLTLRHVCHGTDGVLPLFQVFGALLHPLEILF